MILSLKHFKKGKVMFLPKYKTLKYLLTNPLNLCKFLLFGSLSSKIFRLLPSRLYLKIVYYVMIQKRLNLNNPETFNEKIQWLKLNDLKEYYSKMVDKYEAKQIVEKRIGSRYVIPTLGLWKKFDEIDFDNLPDSFVLKCTHDSGGIVICRDKRTLNLASAKKKIVSSLKMNYYYHGREFPYKKIEPRIIAEKFIDTKNGDVVDYKVHCFNGKARFILACSERYTNSGLKEDFYDLRWNKIPVRRPSYANSANGIPKPSQLNKMIEFAELFSKNIRFLRVDFYEIDGNLLFGEFTFYPASGFAPFVPDEYDKIFGSYLNIYD